MPKFFEVSDEYIANLTRDYTAVYEPYLRAGKGSLVPDDGESPAAIKRQLEKVAKDLGYEVKFLKDKAKPNTVIYTVLTHNTTREFLKDFAAGKDAMEEPDFTPTTDASTEAGGNVWPLEQADIAEQAMVDVLDQEQELPVFSPPLETPEPVEEPVKVKKERARRRGKEEMAAFRAEQAEKKSKKSSKLDAVVAEVKQDLDRQEAELAEDEPQVTMMAKPEELAQEPIAAGTAFEGIATEEHPLVAREKKSGKTPTLYCPSCNMKYVSTKLCVACATPTVPIENLDAILATV